MSIRLQLAPFNSRVRLGSYLTSLGLDQSGVEIGTHRGQFARAILSRWKRGKLYCVDPWAKGYDIDDPASDGDRERDYKRARIRLHPFKNRYEFIRDYSKNASTKFGDGCLDFVYIDGCHRYDSVVEDLECWFPKIQDNGIIAGHDFICPCQSKDPDDPLGWGAFVQPAVFDFIEKHTDNLVIVRLIMEPTNQNWSFMFCKRDFLDSKG